MQARVNLLQVAIALVLALPAFADEAIKSGNAVSGEGKMVPWTERTITSHIDSNDIPRSLGGLELEKFTDAGSKLFTAKFTTLDGAGRPMATQAIVPTKRKRPAAAAFSRTAGPDSNACSGCHNDPAPGGAGEFVANVFVSEGFESADFDSLDPQFSNERGTNHLFGSGLLELLAREMTAELQTQRRQALREARASGKPVRITLETKGVEFGAITALADGQADLSEVEGVDDDLVIRPFSQKGVMTSLRQFTINALNDHFGMQPTERFGIRWTGEADFDGDGVPDEMSPGDISAMVAWQATRHIPTVQPLEDAQWIAAAERGGATFDMLGCSDCHRRALPLKSAVFTDPGPYDVAGTLSASEVERPVSYDLAALEWAKSLPRNANGDIMVPLFGDLKRHVIADRQVAGLGNELLAQRFVERNEFMTAELWGIASTAPYGHRGDLSTLDEVIRAHGGDARAARDAYIEANQDDRSALIAFLKTLVIEP